MINAKDFFVVLTIKFFIVFSFFYYLLIIKNLETVPAMSDQLLYTTDIKNIKENFYLLFSNDTSYHSNNTLYSRIAGFIGSLIPSAIFSPIIPAVILNTFSQIFLALIVTKFYSMLGGDRSLLLFIALNFSPSITAYTFFALRDVLIMFFLTAFILSVLKTDVKRMLFYTLGLFLLRPLFIGYCFYVFLLNWLIGIQSNMKQKKLFLLVTTVLIISIAHTMISLLNFSWIYKLIDRDNFSVLHYISSTLGYGIFTTTFQDVILMNNEETSKTVRFLMFDSLLIPVLAVFSSINLLKSKSTIIKKLAVLILFMMFSLSFAYLAIQGNYPLRKLMPIFPILYLSIFLYLNKNKNKI